MKKFGFPYTGKEVALSVQHLFAMFGATVLVPLLTGLNPSVALLTAGIGTLLFHLVTKMKVPVFLGSSFAFIPGIATVVATQDVQTAQGGIIIAGVVYLLLSLIVYFVGVEKVKKLLPPVVTGPIIMVIGIGLSYAAINNAFGMNYQVSGEIVDGAIANLGVTVTPNWTYVLISLFVIAVVVFGMVKAKGFFKLVPILIGLFAGYALCAMLDALGVVDIMKYEPITDAAWFNIPYVTEGFVSLPKFDITAILIIAPVALVTFMEHIGDITTNGTVVGKDFMKDPGLHRTVLGDGIATLVAGFFGGPANTTYSENTGVLATTKNYDPRLLRLTALFAIGLAFFGKFGGFLETIPGPVKGGVEIVLYGMIAAIGIRTLAESKLDFAHSRNLVIVALILTTGVGITIATYSSYSVAGIPVTIGNVTFGISGLFAATIVGVLANLLLPQKLDEIEQVEEAPKTENA